MKSIITQVGAHKHVIMNYARDEFHSVKGALFNIVDALIDSQRTINSVDSYFKGRVNATDKRIKEDAWKFQLKYSTSIAKRCASEIDDVEAYKTTIEKNTASISKHMNTVEHKFMAGAKKDL